MIVVQPEHLRLIADLAEAAYPAECCGLLVGTEDHDQDGGPLWRVGRVEPSENLAAGERNDRFEIDPRLRLKLQKQLRGGSDAVIGVYHSHPDGPAQPSETDLKNAWEPDLVWLITSVISGQATQTTAHRLIDQASRFEPVPLRTTNWHADPVREPIDLPAGLGRK